MSPQDAGLPPEDDESETLAGASAGWGGFDDEGERQRVIEFALQSLQRKFKDRRGAPDALLGHTPVRGYAHEGAFSFDAWLRASAVTGFQATHLATAVEILREVRDLGLPLYYGFTSNIGTCGLREGVTYLVRERHVRALVTTAGAVEEDVAKVFLPFLLGDARAKGASLLERSVCRTGNIFIPASRYVRLHLLLALLNKRLWRDVVEERGSIGMLEYVRELGRQLELLDIPGREESFVYQAYKNAIPLHCPVLLDGALGDALYYFRRRCRGRRFEMDATDSAFGLIDDMALQGERHGSVALLAVGGSVPKHMICNSAIFAGGASHVVYVNTATEADGSNAGAPIDEAVSWGKVQPEARGVKVEAEASLVLPLIIAGAFQEYRPVRRERETVTVDENGSRAAGGARSGPSNPKP